MCLKDSFFSRNKIIRVIFHKRSSLCIRHSCSHDFHETHHGSRFPVTFRTKSISLFHQSLNCQTRQLFQSSKITKMCYNCLIVFLFQETLKSNLNLRLHCNVAFKFLRISSFEKNIIFAVIFLHQSSHIAFAYRLNRFRNLIDRIRIHFPAEFNLCFHFISFSNSNVSHVVRNPHHTNMTAFHNSNCRPHPGCDLFLYFSVRPVSYDYFAFNSHSGNNMSVFSVSMCRLILIHKIHVDRIIRYFLIKLCMKM